MKRRLICRVKGHNIETMRCPVYKTSPINPVHLIISSKKTMETQDTVIQNTDKDLQELDRMATATDTQSHQN